MIPSTEQEERKADAFLNEISNISDVLKSIDEMKQNKFNFSSETVRLASPIQTAGGKMLAVSLFSKPFSEFECSVFKFLVLGNFTNSFMQKFLFFNALNEFESR